VQYLLAYVLEQQGELEDSRDAFAELITKYPDSKFVPEAWMRIGEYWFDNTTGDANHSLELAADAYTHVAQHPDNALYDKGLYKLGWTWYRLDRYDDAVESFVKLIDTYDQKSRAIAAANAFKGAEKKEASGGELRDEALQYTAVSFADDTWGGVDKAKAFFARLSGGGRSWEPLFWRKLGDIYFDQSKHGPAIEAYHIVLDKDPTATYAPEIQQRIVLAYERDRDFDKARAERDLLVKQFGEGSPWFEANKNDAEVLAKTRDIMERSIYSSAVFHHQQAQEYKKSQKYDLALKEFQAAALAYGTYLERFPHAKNLYETRFFHAETLYNSLQFEAAATGAMSTNRRTRWCSRCRRKSIASRRPASSTRSRSTKRRSVRRTQRSRRSRSRRSASARSRRRTSSCASFRRTRRPPSSSTRAARSTTATTSSTRHAGVSSW